MKKFRNILLLLAVLIGSLVSCKKEEAFHSAENVCGKWTMTAVSNMQQCPDITVEFKSDGSFTMTQTIMEGPAQVFEGRFNLSADGILSGRYSDGTQWADSYDAYLRSGELKLVGRAEPSYYCIFKSYAAK